MAVNEADSRARRLERRARRRESRRARILEAARKLMLERDSETLTMAAVAEAADVSAPAIYYYFKSKEALVDELAVSLLEAEVDAMVEAVAGAPDAATATAAFVRARLAHYQERPDAFALVFDKAAKVGVSRETLEKRVYPLSAKANGALEARLVQAQREGQAHPELHPRKMANVAWCVSQGILEIAATMRQLGGNLKFTVDELGEEACAALRRACAPPVKTRRS